MEFRLWLEDAERDRKVSSLALRVWDKIVKEFDQVGLRKMSLSAPVVGKQETREVKGWGFDLGVLFPEFSGLKILICNAKGAGAAAYDHRSKTILIPLVRDWDDPDEYIVRLRFRSWNKDYKWKFAHEFVHYLDDSRGLKFRDIKEPKGAIGAEYEKERIRQYLNTPEEFNAYYQTLLAAINKKMKPKDFDVDFATFLRNAGTMMPGWESEKWMDKLGSKYRQKFIRRLYGYYAMKRDRKTS